MNAEKRLKKKNSYCENMYVIQRDTTDTQEKLPPPDKDEADILLSDIQEAIKKLKDQRN